MHCPDKKDFRGCSAEYFKTLPLTFLYPVLIGVLCRFWENPACKSGIHQGQQGAIPKLAWRKRQGEYQGPAKRQRNLALSCRSTYSHLESVTIDSFLEIMSKPTFCHKTQLGRGPPAFAWSSVFAGHFGKLRSWAIPSISGCLKVCKSLVSTGCTLE